MGDKEWTAESVFDLFGDALVRRVLVLASDGPVSADDLADDLDRSLPTIYRRVDELSDRDLLEEEMNVADDGNHYTTYETTLESVTFAVDAGGCTVDVSRSGSLADQFEAFWEDLDGSTPDVGGGPDERPDRDSHLEGTDG